MNRKEEFIKLLEEGYSKTIDDYAEEHNLPISAVWQCFADYRNECLIKQSIGTPCEWCKYVTRTDGFTPPCYECCRNKADYYEKI